MGYESEQALWYSAGGDDRECGHMLGPRRDPDRSEQTLKTCKTCGVGELHWVRTAHGWRLWERLFGFQIIFEHICDPIKRREIIASTEQFAVDHDYAAHRKRLGRPL